MRVLIVSDTHGRHQNLDRALEAAGPIDLFVHLGDVEGGEYYINAVVPCEKHIVRGNNDFFSDLPREEVFYIGEKKVFITHGNNYYVSLGPEQIREEGGGTRSRYCNVWTYAPTVSGSADRYYCVESGKPFLSKAGGEKRQLYDHGIIRGRAPSFSDLLFGLEWSEKESKYLKSRRKKQWIFSKKPVKWALRRKIQKMQKKIKKLLTF